jgi:hypothetical protein
MSKELLKICKQCTVKSFEEAVNCREAEKVAEANSKIGCADLLVKSGGATFYNSIESMNREALGPNSASGEQNRTDGYRYRDRSKD